MDGHITIAIDGIDLRSIGDEYLQRLAVAEPRCIAVGKPKHERDDIDSIRPPSSATTTTTIRSRG